MCSAADITAKLSDLLPLMRRSLLEMIISVFWNTLPFHSSTKTMFKIFCKIKYCLIKAEMHAMRGFLDTGWGSEVQSMKVSHVDP
jgi:hypothetical protein